MSPETIVLNLVALVTAGAQWQAGEAAAEIQRVTAELAAERERTAKLELELGAARLELERVLELELRREIEFGAAAPVSKSSKSKP